MNEKKYLKEKVNEVKYNDNRFKLTIGSDRYVFGIISGQDSKAPYSKLLQYKTIYDTLKDIDYKLKISFEKAIEFAYSEAVQSDFSIFNKGSYEETMAYYYIENALFRTSSLWDLLAQLHRLYYQIEVDADKVYYKKIFNPSSPKSDLFKDKAREIYDYIQQEDDTDLEGEWKGNHGYVNAIRNKMTHRNSPNVPVMSDYDVNLKQHPSYILKKIIEDYNVVSKYIGEILDYIENEVMKDFDETK
jgi:hypothetical protein